MFIPDFKEIRKDIRSLYHCDRVLMLFPESFKHGLCMSKSDIYFPRIFSNESKNVPFTSGVVISSIRSEYYLGLTVLDYKLNRNFICPFLASGSHRAIVLDSSKGFSSNVRDINEVPELLNLLSEISSVQSKKSEGVIGRSLELISEVITGRNLSEEVNSLFGELDNMLYSTRYIEKH